MILTAVFNDGGQPKKINFSTPDYLTDKERKNELSRALRERFGKIKRTYKLEWRWD